MQLPHGSPQRLQEYRKYSAIYGRFDAKRKPDKPLTLHEVSVNEAAAQLCLRQPALLTRRDELFPLARQVKTFFDRGLSQFSIPKCNQIYPHNLLFLNLLITC